MWMIGSSKKRIFVHLLLAVLTIAFLSMILVPAASAGVNKWTSNGLGVDVHTLAYSPAFASDQTLFAGTTGSAYKSTNGGASWSLVGNYNLGNGSVNALTLSSNFASDQTLFAGTRYGNTGSVYKSTDGGASWSPANTGLSSASVYTLALSPNFASDQTLFAGTYGGSAYKSTNGGSSWSPVNAGLGNSSVNALALSPNFASDQTLFAGTGGGDYGTTGGAYMSKNGGASWSPVNTGLGNTNVYALAVSPNFASDQTIFAAMNGDVLSYTFDSAPICAKPLLSLSENRVYWSSYADYEDASLSVDFSVANLGSDLAYHWQTTSSTTTNGVVLAPSLPIYVGIIPAGNSFPFSLKYNIPAGVITFRVIVSASAQDACGSTYTYP